MNTKVVTTLVFTGIFIIMGTLYLNSQARTQTRVFSSYSVLTSIWEKYKQSYISEDGRVIDYSVNDITTSEGQSYALLRAVWSDDRATFDSVWKWTKENLNREEDNLFSWKWGKKEDETFGVLANGGENFASEADGDIALALLFAAKRWNHPQYEAEAIPIIQDLWEHSTDTVRDKRYFLPGSWATNDTEIILNPSYFSPYAWRIFAQVDKENDWLSLIDPAYELLKRSGQVTLNEKIHSGLPPNWLQLSKSDGSINAPANQRLTTYYSYDAMRIPWRIALDHYWFQEPKAKDYLHHLSKLSDIYRSTNKLTSTYDHDGTPLTEYESPAMYATALPYFMVTNPDLAKDIFENKIMVFYSNDTNALNDSLNYYDQNWLWFSIALYHDALPNLYGNSNEE